MTDKGMWEIWEYSWGDFYRKFKNEPEKAQEYSFEFGKKMGKALMAKLDLKGNDLDTLAKVVNAFMEECKTEVTAKVEGDKVIYRNRSFCLMMVSAKSFNIPWLWIDENCSWPTLGGLASVVNPNIKHKVTFARARGDPLCEHTFEIIK
ncbi:MAG: hypothetical protein PHD13_06050 [Methanocellales archaeon]|nr:hypothetical protein [Methanocellales archaeon]MDD3291999.1 hypothetical protein [Methanocellales archaeon]MDD5235718.1 hypothetical protein [Methanocellales archaeon]MDD5485644.1 hypothetical protein [Methanocellales archaeon]